MIRRLRRLRATGVLRSLMRETCVLSSQLIYPLFVSSRSGVCEPIKSLPGQSRLGLEPLLKEIEVCMSLGLHHLCYFL